MDEMGILLKCGGELPAIEIKRYQRRYRTILSRGEKECSLPEKVKGKKGRTKKSKSSNLLERLRDYEDDALRFMEV